MKITEILSEAKAVKQRLDPKCWKGKHKEGTKVKGGVRVNNCVPNESVEEGVAEDFEQQFDLIEEMVEALAEAHGVDVDQIWEDFESVDDHELLDESAAWHRKAGKSKTGGLNKKGVASYRREHPGSKLQTAVTTKPSKLKKGSKASKRRKSFCARMGGMKGAMKKPNGKPTRKALALRKWNC
jgi:excinuclease UvrABC ATPase subunit